MPGKNLESVSIGDLLAGLFGEVDTPELREICGEDEWIRYQRDVYWRVRRGLDCDLPLKVLLEQALEDVAARRDKRREKLRSEA